MAKKRTNNYIPDDEHVTKTGRTRTMPEYTLVADRKNDGNKVELITVKGTSAAKAVFMLASEYLTEDYENFRHIKQSTVNFAG